LVKAPLVILVFADMEAYRSPAEVAFMPYLDAGIFLATICYGAHTHGLGSCIVNPHIRPQHRSVFGEQCNPNGHLFCGAVALGYPGQQPECPPKVTTEEFVTWRL
jgi:nitroreductase